MWVLEKVRALSRLMGREWKHEGEGLVRALGGSYTEVRARGSSRRGWKRWCGAAGSFGEGRALKFMRGEDDGGKSAQGVRCWVRFAKMARQALS